VCHAVGDPFDELVAIATEVHADRVVLGRPNTARLRLSRSLAGRLSRLHRWAVDTIE
jgi:hypothetical protein